MVSLPTAQAFAGMPKSWLRFETLRNLRKVPRDPWPNSARQCGRKKSVSAFKNTADIDAIDGNRTLSECTHPESEYEGRSYTFSRA